MKDLEPIVNTVCYAYAPWTWFCSRPDSRWQLEDTNWL